MLQAEGEESTQKNPIHLCIDDFCKVAQTNLSLPFSASTVAAFQFPYLPSSITISPQTPKNFGDDLTGALDVSTLYMGSDTLYMGGWAKENSTPIMKDFVKRFYCFEKSGEPWPPPLLSKALF